TGSWISACWSGARGERSSSDVVRGAGAESSETPDKQGVFAPCRRTTRNDKPLARNGAGGRQTRGRCGVLPGNRGTNAYVGESATQQMTDRVPRGSRGLAAG